MYSIASLISGSSERRSTSMRVLGEKWWSQAASALDSLSSSLHSSMSDVLSNSQHSHRSHQSYHSYHSRQSHSQSAASRSVSRHGLENLSASAHSRGPVDELSFSQHSRTPSQQSGCGIFEEFVFRSADVLDTKSSKSSLERRSRGIIISPVVSTTIEDVDSTHSRG
jgi:hypothetical protein